MVHYKTRLCIVIKEEIWYNLFYVRMKGEKDLKVDETVRQETINMAIGTIILSALMESVFLLIGRWDYTVFLGNLLGGFAAVINFFLMGLTVQSAIQQSEEDAKMKMKTSQTMRMQMLFVVALIGVILSCFNIVAVMVPLFFPRIIITLRSFSGNKEQAGGGENVE